jgi:hypothetical protein
MILDEILAVLGETAYVVLERAAPTLLAYLERQPVPALLLHILVEIFQHQSKDISTLGDVIANDPYAIHKISKFDWGFNQTMRKSLDASNTEGNVTKVDGS